MTCGLSPRNSDRSKDLSLCHISDHVLGVRVIHQTQKSQEGNLLIKKSIYQQRMTLTQEAFDRKSLSGHIFYASELEIFHSS